MKLAKAASYFSTTSVSGWDGTRWLTGVTKITLLPFDRFVSEREFGLFRHYALVPIEDTTLENYPVIKLESSNEIYLVGARNYDLQSDAYSQIYLLHRAVAEGDLVSFTPTVSASGMASALSRTVSGHYYCGVERVTFSRSETFATVRFSEVTLTLPSNCPVDTDNEFVIGTDYYDIQEAYVSSGFKVCRALQKRSA